jgi:glucose/galactose transporter
LTIKQPIYIIGLLFFVFGFVTWLGSVLIPYLRIACELTSYQSYFVAFSFYISYTAMAIPASWVLKKTGFKRGMSLGLLIMAVGALVFIPAALTRQYGLFLAGLFAQGAGLTLLQTAANPYITILGPKESAAKRISIMGICNGVAGMLAPIILGAVILNDADALSAKIATMQAAEKAIRLQELASRAVFPYSVMAVVLVLLAVLIHYSGLPDMHEDPEGNATTNDTNRKKSIWQYPHLLLGVFSLFCYVGVEVIAVDTIAGYAEKLGLPLSKAKFFASFTLLNMLLGYIIGITCIPRFIKQENALKWSAVSGLVFGTAALLTSGIWSVSFIAMLGLSNALIWPSIWPLAIDGLGRLTKTGASLMIMAVGGGAVFPLLYGYLLDTYSAHAAYGLVIPIYFVLLFYAIYGHKIRLR